MTPVTPSFFGRLGCKPNSDAACDAVTPVTAYIQGRTRTHARAGTNQVSHMSQAKKDRQNKGLML